MFVVQFQCEIMVFIIGLFWNVEIFQMLCFFGEFLVFGCLYYVVYEVIWFIGVDVLVVLIVFQNYIQIGVGVFVREMEVDFVSLWKFCEVVQVFGGIVVVVRVMQCEIGFKCVELVCKGDYWCDVDVVVYEEGFGGGFIQFKVVDWFVDKDVVVFGKDVMQEF